MLTFRFPSLHSVALAALLVGFSITGHGTQPEGLGNVPAPGAGAGSTSASGWGGAQVTSSIPGSYLEETACTGSLGDEAPEALAVSPADLKAMVLDPWLEPSVRSLTEGAEPSVFTGGSFTTNDAASDDSALCNAYQRFGRVLGFRRTGFPADDSDEPTIPFPTLESEVAFFRTTAGAADYAAWLASPAGAQALPWASGGNPWLVTRLPGSGANAMLLSRSDTGVARLGLVPYGNFVGEVTFAPGGAGMPTVDLRELSKQVSARLRSAEPTGQPVTVLQLLAAPLPLSAWGERFARLEPDGYSGVTAWDDGNAAVQASYESWPMDEAMTTLRIATTVVVYPDADAANRGAAELRNPIPTAPGFVNVPVSEPSGAFGYRMWATEGGQPTNEWEGGYTWGVIFTRGPVLGRAWLEFGEVTPDAQARDRATVEAAAARLETNVVEVLGVADRAGPPVSMPGAGQSITSSLRSTPSPEPSSIPFPHRPWNELELEPGATVVGTLSIESDTTCALDRAGATWCWGGRVLTGDESRFDIPTATPTRMADGRQMTRLSGSCGLDRSGRAWCWRLGPEQAAPGVPARAVPIGGDHRFTDLSVGEQTSCGLDGERQAWCWQTWADAADADDVAGGTAAQPAPIPGEHRFTTISAGGYHVCGLDEFRRAWCWGLDDEGQAGDGQDRASGYAEPEANPAPVLVAGGHAFTSIAAGGVHTCALDTDGLAWCWGADADGQAGDGTAVGPRKPAPVPVEASHRFTAIAAGGNRTCGIDRLGHAWCWGGRDPAVADDDLGRVRDRPTLVPGGHSFVALAVGAHACAVDRAGRAWCWGASGEGRLGDGVVTPSWNNEGDRVAREHLVPSAVTGGLSFQAPPQVSF